MNRRAQIPTTPTGFDYVNPCLQKFLRQFPHIDRNVFVMMPFTTPLSESLLEVVREEVERHGLNPLRADAMASRLAERLIGSKQV